MHQGTEDELGRQRWRKTLGNFLDSSFFQICSFIVPRPRYFIVNPDEGEPGAKTAKSSAVILISWSKVGSSQDELSTQCSLHLHLRRVFVKKYNTNKQPTTAPASSARTLVVPVTTLTFTDTAKPVPTFTVRRLIESLEGKQGK
jgi:hypothetical protein